MIGFVITIISRSYGKIQFKETMDIYRWVERSL